MRRNPKAISWKEDEISHLTNKITGKACLTRCKICVPVQLNEAQLAAQMKRERKANKHS